MAAKLPDDAELEALARQVNEQLSELHAQPAVTFQLRGFPCEGAKAPPAAPKQQALLEKITGESFEAFWRKYLRNLRKDLCLPGGLLHEQWRKYRDIENKSAVKVAYGVLLGMGISDRWLPPATVAVTVFLLNVALKVGVDTICEGCKAEGETPNETPEKPTKE